MWQIAIFWLLFNFTPETFAIVWNYDLKNISWEMDTWLSRSKYFVSDQLLTSQKCSKRRNLIMLMLFYFIMAKQTLLIGNMTIELLAIQNVILLIDLSYTFLRQNNKRQSDSIFRVENNYLWTYNWNQWLSIAWFPFIGPTCMRLRTSECNYPSRY